VRTIRLMGAAARASAGVAMNTHVDAIRDAALPGGGCDEHVTFLSDTVTDLA